MLAVEGKPSAGSVLCLYHLSSDDTVWTVIAYLSRARFAIPEAADDIFDVIIVAAPDVQANRSWNDLVLQQLPGVLSLLKFVRGYSICATTRDMERPLARFSGTIICQAEWYVRVCGLASNGQVVQLLDTDEVKEASALKYSDLNVSPVASDYIDSWLIAQDANRRIVTVTIDNFSDSMHVVRILNLLGDWAKAETCIVVLIDQRINPPILDRDPGEVFRDFPGIDQNIELRVALYGRSLINVFIGSEYQTIALPPMDRSALVLGTGEVADNSNRLCVLPLTAGADEICGAVASATALALGLTAKGQNQFGEKQMTASVEEFYLLAVKFLQSGGDRVAKAIEILKKILLKNPKHADSWALLGLAAHFFKRHEDAKDLLQSAIALNAKDPAYYFNLGNVYLALDDCPNAIAAMKAALERDPTLYEAYDVLAEIYLNQQEYSQALEYLERASELNYRRQRTSDSRAECFFAMGDPDRALECISDYVSYLAINREKQDAAVVMIWPWCAKLYSSRDAMFLTDYREIAREDRLQRATAD